MKKPLQKAELKDSRTSTNSLRISAADSNPPEGIEKLDPSLLQKGQEVYYIDEGEDEYVHGTVSRVEKQPGRHGRVLVYLLIQDSGSFLSPSGRRGTAAGGAPASFLADADQDSFNAVDDQLEFKIPFDEDLTEGLERYFVNEEQFVSRNAKAYSPEDKEPEEKDKKSLIVQLEEAVETMNDLDARRALEDFDEDKDEDKYEEARERADALRKQIDEIEAEEGPDEFEPTNLDEGTFYDDPADRIEKKASLDQVLSKFVDALKDVAGLDAAWPAEFVQIYQWYQKNRKGAGIAAEEDKSAQKWHLADIHLREELEAFDALNKAAKDFAEKKNEALAIEKKLAEGGQGRKTRRALNRELKKLENDLEEIDTEYRLQRQRLIKTEAENRIDKEEERKRRKAWSKLSDKERAKAKKEWEEKQAKNLEDLSGFVGFQYRPPAGERLGSGGKFIHMGQRHRETKGPLTKERLREELNFIASSFNGFKSRIDYLKNSAASIQEITEEINMLLRIKQWYMTLKSKKGKVTDPALEKEIFESAGRLSRKREEARWDFPVGHEMYARKKLEKKLEEATDPAEISALEEELSDFDKITYHEKYYWKLLKKKQFERIFKDYAPDYTTLKEIAQNPNAILGNDTEDSAPSKTLSARNGLCIAEAQFGEFFNKANLSLKSKAEELATDEDREKSFEAYKEFLNSSDIRANHLNDFIRIWNKATDSGKSLINTKLAAIGFIQKKYQNLGTLLLSPFFDSDPWEGRKDKSPIINEEKHQKAIDVLHENEKRNPFDLIPEELAFVSKGLLERKKRDAEVGEGYVQPREEWTKNLNNLLENYFDEFFARAEDNRFFKDYLLYLNATLRGRIAAAKQAREELVLMMGRRKEFKELRFQEISGRVIDLWFSADQIIVSLDRDLNTKRIEQESIPKLINKLESLSSILKETSEHPSLEKFEVDKQDVMDAKKLADEARQFFLNKSYEKAFTSLQKLKIWSEKLNPVPVMLSSWDVLERLRDVFARASAPTGVPVPGVVRLFGASQDKAILREQVKELNAEEDTLTEILEGKKDKKGEVIEEGLLQKRDTLEEEKENLEKRLDQLTLQLGEEKGLIQYQFNLVDKQLEDIQTAQNIDLTANMMAYQSYEEKTAKAAEIKKKYEKQIEALRLKRESIAGTVSPDAQKEIKKVRKNLNQLEEKLGKIIDEIHEKESRVEQIKRSKRENFLA